MTPAFRFRDFEAYLFDIDGTLVNSRDGVHYHAFHHALRRVFGIAELIDNVPLHGNNDVGILRAMTQRAGISDQEFISKLPEALTQLRNEALRTREQMRLDVCPSIEDLLRSLHEDGKLLGVVSGNVEEIGWAKLEAARLRSYFRFGAFCDSLLDGTGAPAPDSTVERAYIFRAGARKVRDISPGARICITGDTPTDISAARAASLPIVAVATGIYTQQQLEAAGPDLVLDCCTSLLDLTTRAAR